MARKFRANGNSRAPAPPSARHTAQSLAVSPAPLGGTRAEAIRRLQMGALGVVAVLLLIGLASIIKDRATQTDSTAVVGAAATNTPVAPSGAADPLAEAGVVPELPASPASLQPGVQGPAEAASDAPPLAPGDR